MLRFAGVFFCVSCLWAAGARADILCLKDGRIVNGPQMEKTDGGIKVLFKNGTVLVPADIVMEAVIKGGSTFVPETDFEKEQAEKGLVPFQDKWMSPARRDKEIEKYFKKRREEIADEEAHRLWRNRRSEKTKHFEFEYTVPQHIFERYRDLMEAYFTSFAKEWKISQPRKLGRLKVCFYIDQDTFEQVGGVPSGVLGYFRFIPPLELNFFFDRLDPELTEDVMFHETNHYLTKLIDVEFKYPHFPNESLAEYYGASDFDPRKKKLTTGLMQEGRLTQIQTDIAADKIMSLQKLIETDAMFEHYTWGWSLAHFLMNDSRYRKKFQKFVIGLAKGKDVKRVLQGGLKTVRGKEILRVFKRYLGLKKDEDFKQLESEWHAYVKEQLNLVTPRGKEKAAAAAMSTYPARPIRAKRLYSEAIEEGSTNPITYHKYAELLSKDNNYEQAFSMWKRAIELDPLNPQFYAKMGRAVAKHGDKKEGARLLKLAIEIDPDYAWSIEYQLDEILKELGEKGGQ